MFALADVNSFYASCEKVFRPDLRTKPVVVLSKGAVWISEIIVRLARQS